MERIPDPGMTRAAKAPRVPPWGMELASPFSVQLGSAPSMHLISTVGPAGTASLGIAAGAFQAEPRGARRPYRSSLDSAGGRVPGG